MWDSAWFDVSPFIDEAVDFIASAIDVAGGRCLVNCQGRFGLRDVVTYSLFVGIPSP